MKRRTFSQTIREDVRLFIVFDSLSDNGVTGSCRKSGKFLFCLKQQELRNLIGIFERVRMN